MKTSEVSLLAVLLLTIIANRPLDCKRIRSRDYRAYLIRDESTWTSVFQALTDLHVTNEMSAKEIGERILAASAHVHPFKHNYQALAELANTNSAECSPDTVTLCLYIMGQYQLQPLWKFVEASRNRFHKCAQENEQKILDHIKNNSRMRHIVDSLDDFIRLAMGVPSDMAQSDYVTELKKFDMTKNKLKTKQLIIATDKIKFHFNRKTFDFSPLARVERFLSDRCMPFRFVLRYWLDSINLDILLGSELINPEIDRISELHRICVDFVQRRSRVSKNLWKGLWDSMW